MNDLLVSGWQKYHGMSWSPGGSSALAALEAIKKIMSIRDGLHTVNWN